METTRILAAGIVLFGAVTATMSETARVGGSGGERTTEMDCGSNAFIVGITATGGRDGNPFGFDLLRRVKFTCRTFSGTTPGSSTFQTAEAVADQAVHFNESDGSGNCASGQVMENLRLYAAAYIDRLSSGECIGPTQSTSYVYINAGGSGGTEQYLQCPLTEALYKVEARVGDVIDSLKGFCRTFVAISTQSVPTQIYATSSPNPNSAPLVIPVKTAKTISFTISNFNAETPNVSIGVTGQTDLLGGGQANPPELKIELINPSGVVVASKSFSNVTASFGVCAVVYQIDANGAWKMRVTNLKQTVGSLNVTSFGATGVR